MRKHPRRARVDPSHPCAWGTSDSNGMIGQHNKMRWKHDWRGNKIINLRVLVHEDELDKPQRQLGNLVLPADPPPIRYARPENYTIDETTQRMTSTGKMRLTMDGKVRIQSNVQN